MTRVVVVGAGIIGAACAWYAVRAGLDVTVIERQAVAAGTSGAGEGNLLVSDKEPGPELAMMLRSVRLWTELADELGSDGLELERKGGVVVAKTAGALQALRTLAGEQRELEPHLAPGLAGGAFYPDDMQVAPMLAAARILQAAVAAGARLLLGVEATGLRLRHGRVSGVETGQGVIAADFADVVLT